MSSSPPPEPAPAPTTEAPKPVEGPTTPKTSITPAVVKNRPKTSMGSARSLKKAEA